MDRIDGNIVGWLDGLLDRYQGAAEEFERARLTRVTRSTEEGAIPGAEARWKIMTSRGMVEFTIRTDQMEGGSKMEVWRRVQVQCVDKACGTNAWNGRFGQTLERLLEEGSYCYI